MIVADATLPFAWTAVTFPKERYVWFALKNPRILRQTIFWISNGGRHYPPWNGRHVNVLGLEDVTSWFHVGLAESVAKNPISARGHSTLVTLQPDKPLAVPYIMGIAKIPHGFDRVESIEAGPGEKNIILRSSSGKKVKAIGGPHVSEIGGCIKENSGRNPGKENGRFQMQPYTRKRPIIPPNNEDNIYRSWIHNNRDASVAFYNGIPYNLQILLRQ